MPVHLFLQILNYRLSIPSLSESNVFLVFFITVYVTALSVSEITYPLDLGKNFQYFIQADCVFSYSLSFLPDFKPLFESLLFVNILALYGLYIFWTGAEKLLNPPPV